MQIIIDKITRIVLHADEALQLDAVCATNGDWVDHGTTSANAQRLDVSALPDDWLPRAYRYTAEGAFDRVAPAELPAHTPASGAVLPALCWPGGAP